jgi:hypothetical protein
MSFFKKLTKEFSELMGDDKDKDKDKEKDKGKDNNKEQLTGQNEH